MMSRMDYSRSGWKCKKKEREKKRMSNFLSWCVCVIISNWVLGCFLGLVDFCMLLFCGFFLGCSCCDNFYPTLALLEIALLTKLVECNNSMMNRENIEIFM